MKLKDCVPQIDDDYDLDTWDPKEIIEVLWDNGTPYPANILQFEGMKRHNVSIIRKHEQRDFLKVIRKTINKNSENIHYSNCESLNENLKQRYVEIEILQKELEINESSLQETRRKCKEMKIKYKEKKRQMKEENKEVLGEMMKFGLKTIPATKLALCRSDYSKYLGLLDI
ncbi:hypothetical protein AVEN_96657-1 [Araneus ventricosus]|uniref:Uncharacterized protein n=1 Tax=Araneus ventricosus TaxID=182803 RepID=A0A4Y2EAN5_ARAVE|nr:hypothetical protein AVEN_96657-1 [Araneus ventricosus]